MHRCLSGKVFFMVSSVNKKGAAVIAAPLALCLSLCFPLSIRKSGFPHTEAGDRQNRLRVTVFG